MIKPTPVDKKILAAVLVAAILVSTAFPVATAHAAGDIAAAKPLGETMAARAGGTVIAPLDVSAPLDQPDAQALPAQLAALRDAPVAVLERLKVSTKPSEVVLYRALSHHEAISAQSKSLSAAIGSANFQALSATANELAKLAKRDAAVRKLLSSGETPDAALAEFKKYFDGAGRGDSTIVPDTGNLRRSATGLRKYEPPAKPQAVAGSPFQYVRKDGKEFLELKVDGIVRTMEMGVGGPLAPKVRFLKTDILEISMGNKPFVVKLTQDNLHYLAVMMEYLSDPDASLTNLMLRGDMGTGKNTLVYTLAGLLHQGVRVMSFHAHTTEKDLLYRTVLGAERAGETSRKPSEFYEAAAAGDWVVMDEPNKPVQIGILNSLNTILQNSEDPLVKKHPRFRAFALVNPTNRGYAVQEMPADFVRRFNVMDIDYMKPKDEEDYVLDTVFMDASERKKAQLRPLIAQLVGLANDLRSSYRHGDLSRPLSTRGVLSMALHIKMFPKDLPYFREIFDPVYPTEYLDAAEKDVVTEFLEQRGLKGQARPADFKLPDVEIDEKNRKARLGDERWGVAELPLGDLKASEIPEDFRNTPHLQGNLRLWWALMKDRALGGHSLILGEMGTGKTTLAGHFTYALLRLRPEMQPFTRQTRGQDIVGKPELKDGKTYWPPSPLERAVERGSVWQIDEVNKPEDPGTVSLLNNILQFGQIPLPSGKVLNAGPGFSVLATGTPALAQYEAQDFSDEVLDRFRTHVLKPLSKEDEIGLVESYAQKQGLPVERPILAALQQALDSLRTSYRQGRLTAPPSVQALYRVISRLGRFPDTRGDIVRTFLQAFPADDKSQEDVIRKALAPVAKMLVPPAPIGVSPEPALPLAETKDDLEKFHAFADGQKEIDVDGKRFAWSESDEHGFMVKFDPAAGDAKIRELLEYHAFGDLGNADLHVLTLEGQNARDSALLARALSRENAVRGIYMPRSVFERLPGNDAPTPVQMPVEVMRKIKLMPSTRLPNGGKTQTVRIIAKNAALREEWERAGSWNSSAGFTTGTPTETVNFLHSIRRLGENGQVDEIQVDQEIHDLIHAASFVGDPAEALDKDKVGLPARFVTIEPGEFEMGSPADEEHRESDQIPHAVKLTTRIEMQAAPVSQRQFVLGLGRNPSRFKTEEYSDGDHLIVKGQETNADHPVERATWFDAIELANALSIAKGLKPAYVLVVKERDFTGSIREAAVQVNTPNENIYRTEGYRLPTEAEWEYAARAGTTDPRWFDESELDVRAWYEKNSGQRTHAVGGAEHANPWGLHDMLGNVSTWIWECRAPYMINGDHLRKTAVNPAGLETGSLRGIRGGSWEKYDWVLRAAHRDGIEDYTQSAGVGIRFVRSIH